MKALKRLTETPARTCSPTTTNAAARSWRVLLTISRTGREEGTPHCLRRGIQRPVHRAQDPVRAHQDDRHRPSSPTCATSSNRARPRSAPPPCSTTPRTTMPTRARPATCCPASTDSRTRWDGSDACSAADHRATRPVPPRRLRHQRPRAGRRRRRRRRARRHMVERVRREERGRHDGRGRPATPPLNHVIIMDEMHRALRASPLMVGRLDLLTRLNRQWGVG